MNIDRITALEFLEAEANAMRNGSDKPAFKRIMTELKQAPRAQERLAFKLTRMALQEAESGDCTTRTAAWALFFSNAVDHPRTEDFLAELDELILTCFEALGPLGVRSPGFTRLRFTLKFALAVLGRMDKGRLRTTLSVLTDRSANDDTDCRRRILVSATQAPVPASSLLKRLGRLGQERQAANERSARSRMN
jgi:hypothetical protein